MTAIESDENEIPRQIKLVGDFELKAIVKPAVFRAIEQAGEANLRVGVDIPIFPNLWNRVFLSDGEDEIETQCQASYDPRTSLDQRFGPTPLVRLSVFIQEVPEDVMLRQAGAQF